MRYIVRTQVVETYTLEVEADSKEAAEAEAQESIDRDGVAGDWTRDEFSSQPSYDYEVEPLAECE